MSPRAAATKEPALVVAKLEEVLAGFGALRDLLVGDGSSGDSLAGIEEINHSFVHFQLNHLDQVEKLLLRPVSPEATWIDGPGRKERAVSHGNKGDRSDPWSVAFPTYQPVADNTIINEDHVTVEYHVQVVQQDDLRLADRTYSRRTLPWTFFGAYVARTDFGLVSQIDHYYDLSAILRQLGLLADVPMGHDEPFQDAPAPLVHASGFMRPPRESAARTMTVRPVGLEGDVWVGSSQTPKAQRNVENCTAIHEAFVEHTPERFAELIARDSVWIDVPTGQRLNGALTAADHDHGNWQRAFPDSDAVIDALIANDDWVVVQHRGNGTHTGPLQLGGVTYEPTGLPMEIRVLDIVQYGEGPCILIRNYYDTAIMMSQLGILRV